MPENRSHDFVAGIRSDAVFNATGKDWQSWFAWIDEISAAGEQTAELALLIQKHQGLSRWWSKLVASGYYQTRGKLPALLRGNHLAVIKSKAFDVPVAVLFKAWADETIRAQWLGAHPLLIRKAVPEVTMRITWSDQSTNVNLFYYKIGENLSKLALQHVNLESVEQAAELKAFWMETLEKLREYLSKRSQHVD